MTIRNRYPGTCLKCRARVASEAGVAVKVDGKWSVYCQPCHSGAAAPRGTQRDVAPASDPTIEIAMVGVDRVKIRPVAYLGADLFDRYREAAGGATYDKSERANFATVDMVGAIVTRLARAGFKIDAAPEVTAAVQAWEARAKADTVAADARALEVDARLRERGLALFPFQSQGVSWLAPLDRAILGDDMGLGKTIQALTAAPLGAPFLVIAPAVAKGVWARECARWRPDLTPTVLSGRGSFRWPAPGEMVVINYDLLPNPPLTAEEHKRASERVKQLATRKLAGSATADELELLEAHEDSLVQHDKAIELEESCPAGCVLVADEAHAVKGGSKVARGRRFRAISKAVAGANGKRWLLTATPILNRPREMWNLLSLIDAHNIVFGSWPNFLRLTGATQGAYGTVDGGAAGIDERIAPKLREVMLRRLKVDVLDQLPAKTVTVLDVDLDRASIKRLDAIVAELEAAGIDLDEAIRSAGTSDSIAFDQISRARAILANAKTAPAMDLVADLEESGEPVVVFSAHRAPIVMFGNREGWAVITGDTSPAERTKIEERFQRGELKGIAGTIKAAGVAITLTRAAHAIFIDAEWTPALNSQAEDRIYRIGQGRAVSITYLRADHKVDARVFELNTIKRGIIARTVDAAAVRDGAMAERVDAADALEGARAAQTAAEREADAAKLAERVRAERVAFEADRSRRLATIKSESANVNRGWGIDPALFLTQPRPARDVREQWAAEALITLAQLDPDRARARNDVGFNSADGTLGHALAGAAAAGALNDGEWLVAIAVARHYPRQVGQCP